MVKFLTNTYQSTLRITKLVALSLLLISCAEQKLSPLDSDEVILAFGDSLTYGVGAKREQSYPSQLEKLTGLKVINAGISGETTASGVKRFKAELEKSQASLVILMEGGNDILRNQDLQETKTHLASMIQIANEYGAQVILIGVPEKKLLSSSAPIYAELAEEYELIFEEDLLSDLLRQKKYKSDPIHLNAQGYQFFAQEIIEILREHGALAD